MKAMRRLLPADVEGYFHEGATAQDIADTRPPAARASRRPCRWKIRTFARPRIYAAGASGPTLAGFGAPLAPSPVFRGFAADGTPTGVGFVDVTERRRMPDFVGTLRCDGSGGSAPFSGAVGYVPTGTFIAGASLGTNAGGALSAANAIAVPRPTTEIGWAV